MPAFDVDGNRILPADYEKKLPGAIVDLAFTLVHFDFTRSSRLCLYLTRLQILPQAPLPENPSPLKERGREEEGREKEAGEKKEGEKEEGEKEEGGEKDARRQRLRKKPSRICKTLYKIRNLFASA